jgi:hypothetical protein
MTIKEIIFSTIADKFGKEGIHKIMITKDVIKKNTSIDIQFSDNRENKKLDTNFKERKQLDLMLMNKISKQIRLQEVEGFEVGKIYIYINIVTQELTLCYSEKNNDKIILFDN